MGEKATAGRIENLFRSDAGEDAPGPIARRHLHDELLERLRDCIVIGELQPNTKVPEKELCERFGVSRTPLREALKVLAHEGLVILNHNRGATVSPLTLQDLDEAFPIYGRLEALAGELACERMTDAEIQDIRALHEEMVAHYQKRELKRHFEINERIHERIQIGARNQTLLQLLHNLSSRIRRARTYALAFERRLAVAVEEHDAIIAAIEARDGGTLSRLLHEHMDNTFNSIRSTIAEHIPPAVKNKKEFNPSQAEHV
jgi:DNA-binding GntR family transcriptional regulator